MNDTQRSAAIPAAGLDSTAEGTRPRILFLCCGLADSARSSSSDTELADCLGNEDWLVDHCPVPGVPSRRMSSNLLRESVRQVTAKARFIRRLVRLIPGHDIVHLQSGPSRSVTRVVLPALVLAKFFGKKAVLQFCSAEAEPFLEKLGAWFRPLLRAADRIVVGSRHMQKVASRAKLTAAVIDRPMSFPGITHRIVSHLQPRIVMDCPLEPEYNVACGIRAFGLIKQKYPRAELIIAGSGRQLQILEYLVETDHVYGVEFVGRVTGARLDELYGSCDLFLSSSSVDESPPSIVMAFAAGLPVVATDADGVLHMLRDRVNAMVVPVNDHCALADRVIELVEDPQLTSKLSTRGQTEAEKWTWPRVRQGWISLYTDLIS